MVSNVNLHPYIVVLASLDEPAGGAAAVEAESARPAAAAGGAASIPAEPVEVVEVVKGDVTTLEEMEMDRRLKPTKLVLWGTLALGRAVQADLTLAWWDTVTEKSRSTGTFVKCASTLYHS